jgi:transposase-like protein
VHTYRDLEEIMAERGVAVDHATLNRWVVKYSPLIACRAHRRKSATSSSWRMDETYIQVKGKWTYFYRAVDKFGKTLDFMLSEHRDEAAAVPSSLAQSRTTAGLKRSSSTRAVPTWQDCKTSTGCCCCRDGSG